MEQYFLPKKLDFKHLRVCLDHYQAERLFIRDCGGYDDKGKYRPAGHVKVDENLEGRTLDFRKNKSGLYLMINSEDIFHFPLKDYNDSRMRGFTLAYERIEPTADGIGRMIMLSTGIDPDDLNLPEPRRSFLRHILDEHLIEIGFKGRVNLRFHSFWKKDWKYWTIVK